MLGLLLCLSGGVWAQGCAICTKTASQYGEKGAKGINRGIIYLAFIPISILGTLGFVWWRHNKDTI